MNKIRSVEELTANKIDHDGVWWFGKREFEMLIKEYTQDIIEMIEGMKKSERSEQQEITLGNGGRVKHQDIYPENIGYNQALTDIQAKLRETLDNK